MFSDHERYDAGQIEQVISEAARAECCGIVTTEKDAVKVERLLHGPPGVPLFAVRAALEFVEGSEALVVAILRAAGRSV